MGKNWFAVHTHAKAEEKALYHLTNQGFEVYLPRYAKRRSHARRVDTVHVPFFPRYLFVRLDMERARWRAINSSLGVVSMVGAGGRPSPIDDQIIQMLKSREDEAGLIVPVQTPDFAQGAAIRILEGPLVDLVGLFELGEADRVTILLSLLGRPVRVTLPRENVEAA